jgi:TetR/AcrR family transcriptional regulator, tetracycline repressor protein
MMQEEDHDPMPNPDHSADLDSPDVAQDAGAPLGPDGASRAEGAGTPAHDGRAGIQARAEGAGIAPEPALPAPPWAVSRERGARRRSALALDRDGIVAEALRIVDDEGIGALSIRRLADALGVTPMSIYWHVADKAELLELVGQVVIAGIVLPERVADWREDLHAVHRAMVEGFLRHPNVADVLAGRARFGGAGLRLFERILATLLEAGFTPEAAFDAYQSLYLFTLGFMTTAIRTAEFRQGQAEGLAYMATLPEDRFPCIRVVVPVIGRRSLDEQARLGLDVVIAGIAERLR